MPHPSWQREHEVTKPFRRFGKGFTQAPREARQPPHPSCQHPPREEWQKPHPAYGWWQAFQGGEQDLAGWWEQQSDPCQGLQTSRWRPVLQAPQLDRLQRKITEFFPCKPPPLAAPAYCSQACRDEPRGSGDPEPVTQQEQVACPEAPPPGGLREHRLGRGEPRRTRSLVDSQVEPKLEHGTLATRPASCPPAWSRSGMGPLGMADRQLEGGPQPVSQLAEQAVAHTTTPSAAQDECPSERQEPKACGAESGWWSPRSEGSAHERQPQGSEPQLQGKVQGQVPTARSLFTEQEHTEGQTEEAGPPECSEQEGECSDEERRSEGRAGRCPVPGSPWQRQRVQTTQPVPKVSDEEPWPPLGGDVGRRLLGSFR